MRNFDLIVIGSGPAGQRAAIQGAKCGRKVAVIEQREVIGGACINTGTIPSKTMREAVMHLSGFQFQGIYGINYHVKEKITMADLGFRVNQVIKTEVDVTQAQLARNGVEVIIGRASFLDATHVRVDNSRGQADLEAPIIIIATGTKPAVSRKVPLNGRTIINSDQILDDAGYPPHADRGGRRRHRRRVRLHVRDPGRARDPDREASAPAGVRRLGDRGGAVLPPARPSRHACG